MWVPRTFEDHLLDRYLRENPGELLLELEVGTVGPTHGRRRIDGILIPGGAPGVLSPVSADAARERIAGREVHLLEAKRSLNRNVIGQVQVGTALLRRDFGPARITPVAVCARANEDLEWYCEVAGIEVRYYPEVLDQVEKQAPLLETSDERVDVRKPPSTGRRTAFLGGWTDAVQGRLYRSIRLRKTHANMGNLFGWIYGEKTEAFRLATWERYLEEWETSPGQSPAHE